MRQAYRIERRLPFGFRGDWGKLYKRYTPEPQEAVVEDNETIVKFQKNYYADIGQDVQFRESTDETGNDEIPNTGLGIGTDYITVKTTDAYWNNLRKTWECIVAHGDLVRVFGRQWIVQNTGSRMVKRTPNPLKVFYIGLRNTV
jgi:hypothetical protein